MRSFRWAIAAMVLLTASSTLAMFRASDLVVVPVGAALPGLNASNWRTDLEIQNVDTVPVDVMVIFLASSVGSNVTAYRDIGNHLGGRESDGFGHIDARLQDIQPGRAVVLDDVVTTHFGAGIKGALLVFAYQAGTYSTTTPKGGVPKLVVVRSRTYDLGETEDETPVPTSYGQAIPGIPWYFYVDPNQEATGLNEAVFSGITESSSYRTAIGLLNLSDITTSIYVTLTLNAEDGTQLKEVIRFLYPLEHIQFDKAAISLFGLAADSVVENATVSVKVSAWSSEAENPTQALIVYGSRVDNTTNDPVYLEQAFTKEFPWDCVFNGSCAALSALSGPRSPRHPRPLAPPSR